MNRSIHRDHAIRFGALALMAAAFGCDGSPSALDRNPPEIRIVFPAAGEYDRDGDGLVDVEIEFTDPVHRTTVSVETSGALGPGGRGGTDLLEAFQEVEWKQTRLVLEETTGALLPSGSIQIVVRATNRAGSESVASRTVELPAGVLHTRLPIPMAEFSDALGIVMLPDGTRGFVPLRDGRLVSFDPYEVKLERAVSEVFIRDMVTGVYHPTTKKVYIASLSPFIYVFDPVTMKFEGWIQVSDKSIGIELAPSGLLYVALLANAFQALVEVVDPVAGRKIRRLDLGYTDLENPRNPGRIGTPRIPPEGDRLYIPLGVDPFGLLVVDPVSGETRQIIDIHPSPLSQGNAHDSAMDPDRRRLYLTEASGLTEVDIDENRMTRRIESSGYRLRFVSLSPSGRRLFVSSLGASTGDSSESWLVDVDAFTIVARFTVESDLRYGGEYRSVFRPDGQLVFVNHGEDIAVYLNREP